MGPTGNAGDSIDEAVAWLRAAYPHGLVGERSHASGFWRVDARRGEPGLPGCRSFVEVVRRGPGNLPQAFMVVVSHPDDPSTAMDAILSLDDPLDDPRTMPCGKAGFVDALTALCARDPGISPDPVRDAWATERGALELRFGPGDAQAAAMQVHADGFSRDARLFLGTLDEDALPPWEHGPQGIDDDAWRGIDRTFGTAKLRWLLASYPALRGEFLAAWRERDRHGGADAWKGAVEGRLASLLRARRGWPSWFSRKLPQAHSAYMGWEGNGARQVGRVDGERFVDCLDILARIPASWCPDDAADLGLKAWHAFFEACPVIKVAHEMMPGTPMVDLVDCKGLWTEWLGALAALLDGDARDVPSDLRNALGDIVDVAGALVSQVVAPAVARASGYGAADAMTDAERSDLVATTLVNLYGGRSILAVARGSLAWHARRERIEAGIASLPAGPTFSRRWPAAFPDHVEGRARIVILRTPCELADEGRSQDDASGMAGLDHCVGGYAEDCASGRCRIASLRRIGDDGVERRSSTAELALDEDGRATVLQHRAAKNADPDPRDAAILEGYLLRIREGGLAVDGEGLAPMDAPRSVVEVAGYDWGVPGSIEAVAALWRPLLPRRLRRLDAAGWAAALPGSGRLAGDRPPM